MAQRIIFESAESANQRGGCGCLLMIVAGIVAIGGMFGGLIDDWVGGPIGSLFGAIDKLIPFWVALIAGFVGYGLGRALGSD